jgi:ribosomal-protein-alanine N-acetyltransferase
MFNPADINLRRPTADDLSAVKTLDAQVFGNLAYDFFVLRQFFDLHAPGWVVAEYGTELVGYSIIAPDFKGGTAWLLALGVRPEYRGRHIGRKLLEESLSVLSGVGVKHVKLTVVPDNEPAITLYKDCGFTITSQEKDYLGEGHHRTLMELDL